jgi:hypothetical protein
MSEFSSKFMSLVEPVQVPHPVVAKGIHAPEGSPWRIGKRVPAAQPFCLNSHCLSVDPRILT